MPRLIRILVYEGELSALQEALAGRGVKGSHRVGNKLLIRESIVGDFLEPFDHPEPEPKAALCEADLEYFEDNGDSSELSPKERRFAGEAYCPLCFTFGHTHRKDCKFSALGTTHHVTKTKAQNA